jgi:hypothetical protein
MRYKVTEERLVRTTVRREVFVEAETEEEAIENADFSDAKDEVTQWDNGYEQDVPDVWADEANFDNQKPR